MPKFTGLTVGRLRKLLADSDIPDNMPVGIRGHFGELCAFQDIPEVCSTCERWTGGKLFLALCFDRVHIGDEPD